MKKIALFALAASAAAIATPAAAQVVTATGTINITGTVASKCSVGPAGGPMLATWGTNVDMLELSAADGSLETSATLAARFLTQGTTALNARVVCSTGNPKIAVDADPLVNATAAPAGYANTVHFQADVLVDKNTATDATYSNDSNAAPASAVGIGDYLNPAGTNVTVSTSNWRTLTSGALLVAGNYANGKIVVTISPL